MPSRYCVNVYIHVQQYARYERPSLEVLHIHICHGNLYHLVTYEAAFPMMRQDWDTHIPKIFQNEHLIIWTHMCVSSKHLVASDIMSYIYIYIYISPAQKYQIPPPDRIMVDKALREHLILRKTHDPIYHQSDTVIVEDSIYFFIITPVSLIFWSDSLAQGRHISMIMMCEECDKW